MRKRLLTFTLLTVSALRLYAQAPLKHDIALKIAPYKNATVYLANYYGSGKNLADTAFLNENGEGRFNGKRKLTPGMYFVVSPKNTILFEFLLDSAQHFSIRADTARLNDFTISGSVENDRFRRYNTGFAAILKQKNSVNQQLTNTVNPTNKAALQARVSFLIKRLLYYRDSTIRQAPESLTAILINAGKTIELPVGTLVKNHADTVRAGQYLRKHYWDDVPFNDDRLLYTSFFDAKIDSYYKYYVSPVADSVIKELQYMLLYARTGKEMYPYLLMKFTNRYLNPEYIGQNKVFLYLFNDFYIKGDTSLLSAQSKKIIFDRAYQLMANQVGEAAPPLNMTGLDGRPVSLYNIKAPYTMVIFWDPSCSHCQKQIPRIDSMYRAKWKGMGITLFSVNINTTLVSDMAKFITAKHLDPGWVHTYQTDAAAKQIADSGQLNYQQLYDIAETPTLYLLDDKKRIVAKHLSIEQFDALMKVKRATK